MNLRAHAKINLSLAVVDARPDGYHGLRTVFQSLALHDTLRFVEAEEGLEIACSASGVPLDERNLVWKAARLVWAEVGRRGEPRGRVRITKRIPAQGGLGGGSADGAAALVGWDRLWATRLPVGRLRDLARELGADVPFFLCAGTALGLERGDEVHPLDDAASRWVVLVFPTFGVSTPDAFRWWDEDSRRLPAPGFRLPAEPESHAAGPVFNDLEAPVSRRHPELVEIRRALEGAGAEAAAMTGSGSTVFGLFRTRHAAREASDRLTSVGWRTIVTRTATRLQAGLLVGSPAVGPLSGSAALV
jgi:4-diphosphocytidyl-2-C-methyl-D-erythritol kinase